MDPVRLQRLAGLLREELEEIINYELQDPRIREVTVSEVLIGERARLARVRLLVSASKAEQEETFAALAHAKGYIRSLLASRLMLYRVPDLEFEQALGETVTAKMKTLLRRMRKGRPRDLQVADENSGVESE